MPVTASLLLFLPVSEQFASYGVAGLGAYYTRYSTSGTLEDLGFESDYEFNLGYHVGIGTEIPSNDNTAISIDYRYIFLNPNDNEGTIFFGRREKKALKTYLISTSVKS